MALKHKKDYQPDMKIAAVQLLCNSLAELSSEFNININDIIEGLKTSIIKKHYNENPFVSKQELSIKTGIDRRYVERYLTNDIRPETTKLSKVIDQLNNYCYRYKTKTINANKSIPSLKSIVDDLFNKTESYLAIKKELISLGYIKEINGKNKLVVVDTYITYQNDEIKILECAGKAFHSLSKTITHNNKNPDNARSQRRLVSTQISTDKKEKLTKKINSMTKKFFEEVTCVIGQEEKGVQPGKYPEFGISAFIVDDE